MNKIITSIILYSCIMSSSAQKNIALRNHYDNKIQLFAGANIIDFWGPDRHCIGMELSKSIINIGVIRSVDIDKDFSFFGPSNYKKGYEKNIAYTGIRLSNKILSGSLNFGFGSITRYKTIKKVLNYNDGPGNSKVLNYNVIENRTKPCAEIIFKVDLTGRANGIGFIMATNFNSTNVFFDARLVFQLGYAWNRANTPRMRI